MANRRDVVKGGIALAAMVAARPAPSSPSVLFAAASLSTMIVVDRTLPEAAAFAARAAELGYGAHEFAGDIGALWMNVIELRLRAGELSILGFTSAATFFCIETLARDYGARAIARIDATGGAPSAGRDVGVGPSLARLLEADPDGALPPFAHVHTPERAPSALAWRVATHPRFRSVLGAPIRPGSLVATAARGAYHLDSQG